MEAVKINHIRHQLESVSSLPGHSISKSMSIDQAPLKCPNGLIATLWLQLTEIYGPRFVNQYGVYDESGVWSMALADLTKEEMNYGIFLMIRDTRFETWPPNCTQFRHLCLSQLNQSEQVIPNVHQAFNEAKNNLRVKVPQWSHPAVKYTVKYIGVDTLDAPRVDRAFEKFSHAYARVCQRILEGFSVPAVADEEVMLQKKQKSSAPKLKQLLS